MDKEKQTKIKRILSKIKNRNFLNIRSAGTGGNFQVVKDNLTLFFGLGISAYALLSFSSDKYCDGNTASYHSCTNPTTYYSYEISTTCLFIVGVFLITFWYLKRNR